MLLRQYAPSQQPPGGPLLLSPLAESLGFDLVWSGASLHAASRIAGGNRATLGDAGGVTPATGATPDMIGYAFSGSGTGQVTVRVTDTAGCTFVALYSNLTGGASALGRLMSTYNGAGGNDIYCDGVSLHFQVFFSGGSSQRTLNTAPGTGATPICLAWSNDGASTPTSFASVDGAASTVTVTANTSGSRLAGGNVLGIGGRPDTTARQAGARIYLAARSRFALDQAALDHISAKPWASLLRVPQRRIWVPVSAGGGGGAVGSVFRSGVFGSNVLRRAA